MDKLTAKRIDEALYLGYTHGLNEKISNLNSFGKSQTYRYVFRQEEYMLIAETQRDDGEAVEIEVSLKKGTGPKITVFHYDKEKDELEKSEWIHEGVWQDIILKLVEENESAFKSLLREFEKSFRLPSLLC